MNATFDINALGPLISSFFLFSLGLVSLSTGPREQSWRWLAAFSFSLGVAATAVFGAMHIENPDSILLLVRLALVSSMVSVLFGNAYARVLSGRRSRFWFINWFCETPSRLAGYWVAALGILALLLFTDLMVSGVVGTNGVQGTVIYGPLAAPLGLLSLLGMLRVSVTMRKAHRHTENPAKRTFYRLHGLAFNLIYLPALLLEVAEPILKQRFDLLVFSAFPLAVVILYVAFLRYERARVEELTEGLQLKVFEQTAALKESQAKLAQRDKQASLGLIVASVSHEINNPLGAILSMQDVSTRAIKKLNGIFENSPDKIPTDDEIARLLRVIGSSNEVMEGGVKRISEFVARLKGFVTLDEAETQVADIHSGLDDAVMLVQPFKPHGISIVKSYGSVSPLVCRPGQLNQVFLNLLVNAIQAIDGSGVITIATFENEDCVEISIVDSGSGIRSEVLNRIFEAGFTTKMEQGIGLGLAIAKQIIEDHNGTITLESKRGVGTTFTISLPLHQINWWSGGRPSGADEGKSLNTMES